MGEIIETQQSVAETATPAPGAAGPDGVGAAQVVTSRQEVVRKVSHRETGRRIILLLFGIVQLAIVLRFALLLAGANPTGIVDAIHSFSQLFVGPFMGIFPNSAAGGSVMEWASIAALAGWTIAEFLVLAVWQIATRRPDGVTS